MQSLLIGHGSDSNLHLLNRSRCPASSKSPRRENSCPNVPQVDLRQLEQNPFSYNFVVTDPEPVRRRARGQLSPDVGVGHICGDFAVFVVSLSWLNIYFGRHVLQHLDGRQFVSGGGNLRMLIA